MPTLKFDSSPNDLIPARAYIKRIGAGSLMTLHRWRADPKMNLSQPVYINGRRYWTEAQADADAESLRTRGESAPTSNPERAIEARRRKRNAGTVSAPNVEA